MIDHELYEFANDVYDVLVGNDNMCTQQGFMLKHGEEDVEVNSATNTIYIGKFKIEVSRKEV